MGDPLPQDAETFFSIKVFNFSANKYKFRPLPYIYISFYASSLIVENIVPHWLK